MFTIKIKKKLIPIVISSLVILGLCFSNAYIVSYIPRILTIQVYGRLLSLVICLGYTMLKFKVVFRSKTSMFASLLAVISILSTIVNGGDIVACINTFIPMLLIVSFLDLNIKREERLFAILNTWKWICVIFTLVDIVTNIMYPDGLYSTALYTENWFLGYKTERFIYIFPMMVISGYIDIKKSGKPKVGFYVSYIIGFVSCYLSGATTCWVAMLFFIALYSALRFIHGSKASLWKKKLLYRLTDYRVGIILYTTILACTILAENIPFVVDLTTMLGKDPTFSRRSLVWSALILQLLNKPVLGLGYLSSADYVSIVSYTGGTNAHNMILSVLIYGGCIGLLIYVVSFVYSLYRVQKEYTLTDLYMIASVYSFLITGVTSSIMVYSVFGYLCYWILEYEKRGYKLHAT